MDARLDAQFHAHHLKEQMIGSRYKHFKGSIYVVDNIAVHSETAEAMVVYHNENNSDLVWCRPLTMFLSEVDHDKYPDVEQRWRFECIDDKQCE